MNVDFYGVTLRDEKLLFLLKLLFMTSVEEENELN
jgi:hypothetical protein